MFFYSKLSPFIVPSNIPASVSSLQCVQALKNWGVPQGIRHPSLIYAVKEQALAAK